MKFVFRLIAGVLYISTILKLDVNSKFIGSKDPKDKESPFNIGKFYDLMDKVKVLETKLEAEKNFTEELQLKLQNAEKNTEKNAKNMSARLQDVEETVSIDQRYWNSSDTCGGVIIGQSGQITLSNLLARLFSSNPHVTCVWTVRTNYRSKIKLHGISFAPLNTVVTEFFLKEDGTHTSNATKIIASTQYLFNGPVILITTQAPLLAGFKIVFEGFGKRIHRDTDFRHFNYKENDGSYQSSLDSINSSPTTNAFKKTFSTVVINTGRTILTELGVNYSQNCLNSSLKIQKKIYNDFESNESLDSSCCNKTSCSLQRYYTLDGWFAASYSSISPVGKLDLKWISRSNDTDSINKCGGILMGKTGKISYRRSTNYLNNERCVWVLYPFPKSAVRISQVVSGMESTYDHLVLTEIDSPVVQNYELASPPLFRRMGNFTGRVILITFYTDSSIVRQGFELTWEAVGPSNHSRSLESERINELSLKDGNSLTKMTKTQDDDGFILFIMNGRERGGIQLNFSATTIKTTTNSESCKAAEIGLYSSNGGHISGENNPMTTVCGVSPQTVIMQSVTSPDGLTYMLLSDHGSDMTINMTVNWNYVASDETESTLEGGCGGIVHGMSGRISHKLEEIYDNGERCIWILHTPTSSQIELTLLKDGFEACCDFIIVNTVNPENASINAATTILTRENNTRTFDGPVIIITFRADGSVTGKGFTLKYTGKGTLQNHPYNYKLIHRDEPLGILEYPNIGTGDDGWSFGTDPTELLIIAYSSPIEPNDLAAGVNFNVTVENVFLGMDENCHSDKLNFYTSPSRDGFSLSENYPKEKCQKLSDGTCGSCIQNEHAANDTSLHAFGSSFRAFVALYRPVAANNPNRSFYVHWDTSAGCGGVIYEATGRINYKLGARYKNSEQCIFTIHAPDALGISFTLMRNGFEACCDYLSLNSLIPENGTLSPATIIKSESSSSVVMKGPVVFVTFKSDSSVTGEGFSLSFTSINSLNNRMNANITTQLLIGDNTTLLDSSTNQTETDFQYLHYHGRRRNSSFTYPRNKGLSGLSANEILTYTYSPEPGRLESFDRVGSEITVNELHLEVDIETCISDTLRFYQRNMSELYLARSYSVNLTLDEGNESCPSSANTAWTCEDCFLNETSRIDQLTFTTELPGFIVIFKSVTSKGIHKPFIMGWQDRHQIISTSTSSPYSG